MDWFINLFIECLDKSKKSPGDIEKRIKNVNDYFTLSIFNNVSRSLFEKDKLLFSFLLLSKILH